MTMSAVAVNNGVNVEALIGAREALAKACPLLVDINVT